VIFYRWENVGSSGRNVFIASASASGWSLWIQWTWTTPHGVNFHNLEIYQVTVRFLPHAAAIADSLSPLGYS
jgi:hypothetical protein